MKLTLKLILNIPETVLLSSQTQHNLPHMDYLCNSGNFLECPAVAAAAHSLTVIHPPFTFSAISPIVFLSLSLSLSLSPPRVHQEGA